MLDAQPKTVEDWVKLSDQYRAATLALESRADLRGVLWSQAGFSVECLLKAAIHQRERFNEWPRDRRDLNVHDLRALAKYLNAEPSSTDPVAPAWTIVLQWRRSHMYNPEEFSERVLEDLLDAVFGAEGVLAWIRQTYLRGY